MPQYVQRLESARRTLVAARRAPVAQRDAGVAAARRTLAETDAVAPPSGGTVRIDDERLLERLDTSDAGIDATVARIDARIALVTRVGSPAVDPARSDAALRDAAGATISGNGASITDILSAIVLRFLAGLRGPNLDFSILWTALGAVGVAVILFIVAILGRGLPERVRREVLVSDRAGEGRPDPTAHLRGAEAALASGHPREAIHAFFLYVIAALASREVLRYDPSFTDRELLVATAAIPHADALRDLVAIYERSWFGVREPSAEEARRARELALRVAP